MSARPLRRLPSDRPPVLIFAPLAWLKLQFFCHAGDTEIGGFGISAADDLLYVEDFCTVRQHVTALSVRFDDNAVADHFDACVDQGVSLARCARIWLHTHPGTSAEPSGTDEDTFDRVFGSCDWSLLFILSRTGQTHARLSFSAGPGGQLLLPVQVDWQAWPMRIVSQPEALASCLEQWRREYSDHIQVRPESFLPIRRMPAREQRRDANGRDLERWWQEWEEQLGPLTEEMANDEFIYQFPAAESGPAATCPPTPRPAG